MFEVVNLGARDVAGDKNCTKVVETYDLRPCPQAHENRVVLCNRSDFPCLAFAVHSAVVLGRVWAASIMSSKRQHFFRSAFPTHGVNWASMNNMFARRSRRQAAPHVARAVDR